VEPEDFVVDELPLYPAAGHGDHVFLHIEKRLRSTEEVARDLARAAGASPRDVGYAGRKDRVAVTRQWFSVPGLDPVRAAALELDRARVLEAVRHPHKLRTGQLRGNRFGLRLRDVDPNRRADVADALEALCREGLPNRFGPQRFGRSGDNAEQGRDLLLQRRRVRDRRQARFLISALQAAIFNDVLERRARPLSRLVIGDVACVHDSGGLFRVEDTVKEQGRADAFEISATGPIVGPRTLTPEGAPARAEREALAGAGLDPDALPAPPRGVRMRGARRPLRVRPGSCDVQSGEGPSLHVAFTLPPGSYASVLLEELASRCGLTLEAPLPPGG
jgi:tRNA pseudouridine13 synthase